MAQNVIINGVTYQNVPEVDIPKSGGGTAKFYDTAGASVSASDLLTGKTAYGASGEVSGSMANNGSTSGTISTKAGTVTIPAGYTTGGTVSISSTEQAKENFTKFFQERQQAHTQNTVQSCSHPHVIQSSMSATITQPKAKNKQNFCKQISKIQRGQLV